MFGLKQALLDHELIVLRVIGEWWELDLTGTEKLACVNELARTLGDLDMLMEINYLGLEESEALKDLINAGGRMPVATFVRLHGTVRYMGPGRLEREEPWLEPVSAAEALWYRGFLFKAFEESESTDLVEYYYLPNEYYAQFTESSLETETSIAQSITLLNPITAPEEFDSENNDAVDDVTTIIAIAQNRPIREKDLINIQKYLLKPNIDRATLLYKISWELGLFRETDEGFRPSRKIITWLQKSREAALRDLVDTWSRSSWNELRATPGIACEGSGWENDPILARTAILDFLPRDESWHLTSELVSLIKEEAPDFQRPDGKYDNWYIRDLASGSYVTGFENWHLVEGRLLQFMIQGPMFWLGLTEISTSEANDDRLFRLTPRALAWLDDQAVVTEEVDVPIIINGNATIIVPFNANRYHRFQVARLSEFEAVQPNNPYRYRLTPRSLSQAMDQGIEPDRIVGFLEKISGRSLPPSTKRGIERWSETGTEAKLEDVILLRVRDAEILEKLRENPKTRDFISESMGDLAVVVRRGKWLDLQEAAAELGLLIDRDMHDGLPII